MMSRLLLLVCAVGVARGDMYLHHPRGSNNRLNERNANRNNANRMFDSQNNNQGGYNVGDKLSTPAGNNANNQFAPTYYSGALVHMEWTNQHGCGGSNDGPHKTECNIILQYMCQPDTGATGMVRDGTNTQIQTFDQGQNNERIRQWNIRKDKPRTDKGLHESFEHYNDCETVERNRGLFTADQNLQNNNKGVSSAKFTRQNPAGTRSGYECPEERDYYPYWRPSPWVDIAVLTDNNTLCAIYEEESFNEVPRGVCVETFVDNANVRRSSQYNNPEECADNGGTWHLYYQYMYKDGQYTNQAQCEQNRGDGHTRKWAPAIDNRALANGRPVSECLVIPDPVECRATHFSRDNHLGNGVTGQPLSYNWTVPDFPSNYRCALRARYNISTTDYPAGTDASNNTDEQTGVVSPIQQNPVVKVSRTDALQLAINTAQFGRTFQDRSHSFLISPRPAGVAAGATVYELMVRGKRGNIVQVYPAVEYDFIPNILHIKEGDLIHVQWTGSNTHDNNNNGDDGEGTGGTDRSNIVQMSARDENYPLPFERTTMWANGTMVHGPDTIRTPKDLAAYFASSGFYKCATGCSDAMDGNKQLNNLLNNAPASFEGAVLRLRKGTYYYMCTRNNNFTNRSQKGVIVVS